MEPQKRERRENVQSAPRPGRKPKEPKLFEGERHGILYVPGKGMERANYMGPGTKIFERLRRGDKGKTPIDQISKLHDIDYTLASAAKDQQEHEKLGREADERMIRSGWKAYKQGKEGIFNLSEGAGLIKAKTLIEDWGIMSKTKFLSPRSFKYQLGAANRDASEYEILLRSRAKMVCGDGVTGDAGECQKTKQDLVNSK